MQFQDITRLAAGILALIFFSSCTMGKSVTVVDGSKVRQTEKIEKKKTTVVDDSQVRQLEKKIRR